MPASSYPEEVAPPLMAVTFHVYDFIQASSKSEQKLKAIAFVQDYVMNPSLDKTFCDEASLESYGLMPSQKGKVTKGELEAIAKYMFSFYNQENLLKLIKDQQEYDDLSEGEKLARKHKCVSCHKQTLYTMSPPLHEMWARYKDRPELMRESITNGSQGKWKQSRGAMMPSFKDLSAEEIDTLLVWIEKQ